MTLGGKYKWKPLNDNPPPGVYDVESAKNSTLKRNSSVLIRK
jgi:hypothetical protein